MKNDSIPRASDVRDGKLVAEQRHSSGTDAVIISPAPPCPGPTTLYFQDVPNAGDIAFAGRITVVAVLGYVELETGIRLPQDASVSIVRIDEVLKGDASSVGKEARLTSVDRCL